MVPVMWLKNTLRFPRTSLRKIASETLDNRTERIAAKFDVLRVGVLSR
jgi:hypothetical protein